MNDWRLDPKHRSHETARDVIACVYPGATIVGAGRWATIDRDGTRIVLHKTRGRAELVSDVALAEVIPWCAAIVVDPIRDDDPPKVIRGGA